MIGTVRKAIRFPVMHADLYLSRRIYGNAAGMRNNRMGRKELEECQRFFEGGAHAHEARLGADVLRTQGYWRSEKRASPEVLETVRRRYEEIIENPDHSVATEMQYDGRKIVGSRSLSDPLGSIPEVRHFLTQDIADVLTAYYDSHFVIKRVNAWRNYPLPSDKADVFSNHWHADAFPVTGLRLFVYLREVTDATGAFRLHPIPSTKEIMRSGYVSREKIFGAAKNMVEDPSRVVCFEGSPGTVFIANVQHCLHRAGVPQDGTRRDVIQFFISPSKTPIKRDWYLSNRSLSRSGGSVLT